MKNQATTRNLDGKPAILFGIMGPERKIIVLVDSEERTLTRDEWDVLPPWNGPAPAPQK